jgi:oligopeptide transport system ATP-binding protein
VDIRSGAGSMSDDPKQVLLSLRNVKKYFPIRGGFFAGHQGVVKAVDDVSLDIYDGETLGLVGESGCGKSTLGRLIVRLEKPTAGAILFDRQNIQTYTKQTLKDYRKNVQLIFQDPYASLNPRRTAGRIMGEPFVIHGYPDQKKAGHDDIAALMAVVGLHTDQIGRYPHEFSGGQRQRIGIARAIALKPRLIVADEPVSALDVSIQAQILNLLNDLQKQFTLTYLFISHDLSVVRHMSDRIAVMYLGKIVELDENDDLNHAPLHPYTKALLSAVPVPDPTGTRTISPLNGDIPDLLQAPSGCVFHPRCPERLSLCNQSAPVLREQEKGRMVACHLRR